MNVSTNGHHRAESERSPANSSGIEPVTSARRTEAVSDPQGSSQPKTRTFGALPWVGLGLILFTVAVIWVFVQRAHDSAALVAQTHDLTAITVSVIIPERAEVNQHLVLPGTVQAEMETAVYAQVSGYIKRWLVDIGTQVKEGQVLAEIDTPVLDQQVQQSRAAVAQVEASLKLAKSTAARYEDLLARNAVSRQDVDSQAAAVSVQEANLAAAQANVRSLEEALKFKLVRAPFDGVVTARKIDLGELVTANSTGSEARGSAPSTSATPSQELFRVALTRTLRVYVNVPEKFSKQVKPGTVATVEMASAPDDKVEGRLTRTSESIDPSSLTLLAEVDVPNPTGKLLPGGFARVHFDLTLDNPPLVIPGNALLFRSQGAQVGIVDPVNHMVHLKDIVIGRDFGTKLEVVRGLEPNDRVIVNPSDSLYEGQKVQIYTAPAAVRP